ncbi:ectodysplasin-A receptor-associated adapter protein isoform X2 [Petromyzon marinus]|uniref:Ectodysplasin-A receptor-associated adapter protein isoform X2 n=1 Tax=Petromyzon marinus TaxID=7757 RepID=A0AAJ7U6N5_PETMA|nr:ectodysplasin-A receptor-associated adapter protein isoform X2 [Petromyzon marinus]
MEHDHSGATSTLEHCAAVPAKAAAPAGNGCSSPRRPVESDYRSDAAATLELVTPVQETDPVQGELVTAREKRQSPGLTKEETAPFETEASNPIAIPGKTPTETPTEKAAESPNGSSGGQSCPNLPPAIDPVTSAPVSLCSGTERPQPTVLDFMDDADAFYRLKAKLDPSHSIIKNWRHVGSRWGLSYDELSLLEERGRGGRSPTEEVLLRNGHRPLAQLVQQCRDLNRIDAALLLQDWVAQTWRRGPRQQEELGHSWR